jgi:hypothetical protein
MRITLTVLFLADGVLVGAFMPDEWRDKIKSQTCEEVQKRVAEYCVAKTGMPTPDKQ